MYCSVEMTYSGITRTRYALPASTTAGVSVNRYMSWLLKGRTMAHSTAHIATESSRIDRTPDLTRSMRPAPIFCPT